MLNIKARNSVSLSGNQLNIFTEASWVNSKKSPFKQLKSGIFEARYSGIYLVYGQVLAYSAIALNVLVDLCKKVQVGKDQEKAQSEKDSHSKNRDGKKLN